MLEISEQMQGGPITEDLMLRGQIVDSAVVQPGVHFLLLGQVTGDLIVEAGGKAEVFGMVCGDLINRGRLELAGTVIGSLLDESGDSEIDAKAQIGPKT